MFRRIRAVQPKPAKGPPAAPIATSRQILDAAAVLLRSQGYESTTTRAIAKQIGIQAGSLYHHYPSKDAIIATVIIEGVQIVQAAVEKALADLGPDATPRDKLESAVRAHLRSLLENSNYTSASIRAFAFLPREVRQKCRGARREYAAIWTNLVEEAAKAGLIRISQDVTRNITLGSLNSIIEWYRPGVFDIDSIASDFAELIFGKSSAPISSRRDRKSAASLA